MKKSDLKLLEKVWIAEIENRLPLQSKEKGFNQLEEDGFVEKITRILEGRFPVSITGYILTHYGRWPYCANCGEDSQ